MGRYLGSYGSQYSAITLLTFLALLADRLGLRRGLPVLAFRAVQELLRGAGLGVQVVALGRPTRAVQVVASGLSVVWRSC